MITHKATLHAKKPNNYVMWHRISVYLDAAWNCAHIWIMMYFLSFAVLPSFLPVYDLWARASKNQQNDLCARKRLQMSLSNPPSLIRVFVKRFMGGYKPKPSGGQQSLLSDVTVDLSLHWINIQLVLSCSCILTGKCEKKYMSRLMTKPTMWLCA